MASGWIQFRSAGISVAGNGPLNRVVWGCWWSTTRAVARSGGPGRLAVGNCRSAWITACIGRGRICDQRPDRGFAAARIDLWW